MKRKKVKIPYEVLLARLEKAVANYNEKKDAETMKVVKEVCADIVANTVNPTTPPPPPTTPNP
jgi:hypothetical protein